MGFMGVQSLRSSVNLSAGLPSFVSQCRRFVTCLENNGYVVTRDFVKKNTNYHRAVG